MTDKTYNIAQLGLCASLHGRLVEMDDIAFLQVLSGLELDGPIPRMQTFQCTSQGSTEVISDLGIAAASGSGSYWSFIHIRAHMYMCICTHTHTHAHTAELLLSVAQELFWDFRDRR